MVSGRGWQGKVANFCGCFLKFPAWIVKALDVLKLTEISLAGKSVVGFLSKIVWK